MAAVLDLCSRRIVGWSMSANALTELARWRGVIDRVHFLGQRDSVPALLEAMDVGVIASYEEELSNALLEKLAAGLPVIATNVGGNPGRGRRHAQLPPRALARRQGSGARHSRGAERVHRCGRDDERRRIMHNRFSVPAMVDAYERLYALGTAVLRPVSPAGAQRPAEPLGASPTTCGGCG